MLQPLTLVKHVERPAAELYECSVRILGRPLSPIDVSTYCRYRCDFAQS